MTTAVSFPKAKTLSLPGAELSAIAFIIHKGIDRHDWANLGIWLANVRSSSAWWRGDWMLYGVDNFAGIISPHAVGIERQKEETIKHVCERMGWAYGSVRNEMVVSRAFPLSRRYDKLSWYHHAILSAMPTHQQAHWLDLCADHNGEGIGSAQNLKRSLDAGLTHLMTDAELAQLRGTSKPVPSLVSIGHVLKQWRAEHNVQTASVDLLEQARDELEPFVALYNEIIERLAK